ncbi:NAD(+) synthase [Sanguibacter sp. HDW7]|uniref:NAD(+) synthase n=1 Tax=Sanguibacter sp. HDW7 TaxID=2714931 RepID=UPI00140C39FC|nr:NAD(+) synthase [Sanguibacter sp. HDW7]QIK82626.1 NAD(+) synthase [Sanguibacter sp. HDW7]
MSTRDWEGVLDAMADGIARTASDARVGRVVVGVSGGLDGAVVAVAAARALRGENVLTAFMPTRHSSQASHDDAAAIGRNLGTDHHVISIDESYAVLRAAVQDGMAGSPAWPGFTDATTSVTEQNIQARLRGTTLMAIANATGGIVLNTGNLSEVRTGYFTLYGDGIGAVAPLGQLYKTEVQELAAWINRDAEVIPAYTVSRPPSAELADDQEDSDSLPPYPVLDAALRALAAGAGRPDGVDEAAWARTQQLASGAAFKARYLPPSVDLPA